MGHYHQYTRSGNHVMRGGAVPPLLTNQAVKTPIHIGGALTPLRVSNVVGGITNDNIKRIYPADYGHQMHFTHGQGIKHGGHERLAGLLSDAVKEPGTKSHQQKRQNIKFNI